jgi:beta-galactosidase
LAKSKLSASVSRREVLRWGAAAAVLADPLARTLLAAPVQRGPAHQRIPLQDGWTVSSANASGTSSETVTLPHTPVKLSWQGWDPTSWEHLWTYRRTFASPLQSDEKQRVFLRFEGVMSGAKPSINGHALEEHLGGFLPFDREITSFVQDRNELVVTVDGNWLNVPPSGSPKGPHQLDYLLPAGIHREVSLRILPQIFLDEVFAKPVDVLSDNRRLEIQCTLDAAVAATGALRIDAELMDGTTVVSKTSAVTSVHAPGRSDMHFTMKGLDHVGLWSPDDPKLYTLKVTLRSGAKTMHEFVTRVGFRDAHFAVDGFYLNGKKSRIFGLNRHELFPYTGFAMPDRVMRRDAEMLRHEFNCNTVRCSHYPQTEAFLDACDELGLMVWEEVPGWQYIGDDTWKQLLMRDVRTMIVRDRNHPSIIIWGVRVNESANNPPLYASTRALAKSLDDSRQASGTMTRLSKENWAEDVFAYDDYHAAPDGSVAMHKPVEGVPFFFAEGVGQFGYEHGGQFTQYYRRAGARDMQEGQAKYHAQGHDRAVDDPRSGGLIAWCAFDYASILNGYKAVKCPGVVDTFRIPKLGATFYQSQVSPSIKPVIEPSFYWDFTGGSGPGSKAHIFSNCDRLSVTVGAGKTISVNADKKGYPHLAYPPFVVDLNKAPKSGEDLVIEGFVGDRSVLTRRLSSDRSKDKLMIHSDDAIIANDGSDATRIWFAVCDQYGSIMQHLDGDIAVSMEGPGELVGDAKFVLAETGGVGAVWIRSKPGAHGTVRVHASHPHFGTQTVSVEVKALA